MSIEAKLDRLQRRHKALGLPLAVIYKYIDDSGGYLAALLTYYAFVSLFPLLLVFTTLLDLVLAGNPDLQQQIATSTLSQFPVLGDQLTRPDGIGGGPVGLAIGIVGALYGGLGVAQAAQYAMNTAWAVPRNERPDPFKSRGRGLLLLVTAGTAILATTGLSAVGASGAGSLGLLLRTVLLASAMLINAAAFVFVFRIATARHLTAREVLPGALAAAVSWQLLQTFGVAYVAHVVKNASATNGVFAIVLGLLAFLYITSVVVVLCAEINVVRAGELYPRALLTPFTDNVDLTSGDRRTYTRQAEAQRAKGFEDIDVTFHKDET